MVRGNKGEWSEFYTFLRLLSDRQISAADEHLQKKEGVTYPVVKIVREEATGKIEYEFVEDDKIKISAEGKESVVVDGSDLTQKVAEVFERIKEKTDTTFEISVAEELMARFHVGQLKAGNSRKEDLILQVHSGSSTAGSEEIGFSIKSMLGGDATLLNASTATNFIYKITGLPEDTVADINDIETRSKIRDRLAAIAAAGGTFSYHGMQSETFEKNLRKVDMGLPEIAAELTLAYYSHKDNALPALVSNLGASDVKILSFDLDESDYEFKLKSLLHNVALGMVPNSAWDGRLRAHGGYIVIRDDGELVCYHANNADDFRSYLFKNTRLETPSTTRHGFGKIYKEGDDLLIKLNLQIRFAR